MPRSDMVERLATVDLFSTLHRPRAGPDRPGHRRPRRRRGRPRTWSSRGRRDTELYLIVEGEADVVRDGQPVVARLGPGQYFGELAVLDDAPRGRHGHGRTPARAATCSGQREVAAVLDEWPGVARKLVTQMAARLREAEQGEASH